MSSNGVLTRLKSQDNQKASSPYALKAALAQKLRGGVVIEVASPRQARIAEAAGAVAVVALGTRPPPGGVSRMSDPELIREIKAAVRIPVIGSARIGHFVEAQILQVIGVDFIDESEVLTPADDTHYINKHKFRIPFVCGCCNLGDALRRVAEGAAIIRAKGEAGTGNIVEAVRHVRSVLADIRKLQTLHGDEIYSFARQLRAPFELVKLTKQLGRLPAVNFGAGGVATPADAAMMMQLGCDGVFVESEIFNSGDPAMRVRAIVRAVTHYNDSRILAEVSSNLGEAVVG